MDYESLLKEHQYSTILDLTKDKIDANSLSYRINAFIALSNYKEALKIIKKYNDILYKHNPLATMRLHFELLFELKMFIDAINAHHDYSERPYISQQVEEYLREVPNQIIRAQKNNEAQELFLDENKVNEIFTKSKDAALLTNSIYHLKKLEVTPYLSSLLTLLKRKDIADDIKTLALLILIMKRVDFDAVIFKHNKEIKINPAKMNAPYAELEYKAIMNEIIKISKDPTIENVATNLFNQYVLNVFPDPLYDAHTKTMAVAFVALAKRYLKEEAAVNEVISTNNQDIKEVNKLLTKYQKEIENK